MNKTTNNRLNFFKKNVKGKVLELTVGTLDFPQFYDKDCEITVIDFDEDYLSKAKKYSHKQIKHNLETKLPFSDETFDVVVAGEIIEHLKDTRQLIQESYRVLKKGGVFVGSTPNADNIRNNLKMLLGIFPDVEHEHIRFYTKRSLNNQLKKCFPEGRTYFNGFLRGGLIWKCRK